MDSIYKGLGVPRQNIAAGRPDILPEDRPGHALIEMVREAAATGFTRPEQLPVSGPAPVASADRPRPAASGPRQDYDDADLTA